MQTLKTRAQIPAEYTWNLESVFATKEDWERAYQSLQCRLPELLAVRGTLAENGLALLAVLRKRDALFEEVERLSVYASLRSDEDTTNNMYQDMAERARQLAVEVSTAASFIEDDRQR